MDIIQDPFVKFCILFNIKKDEVFLRVIDVYLCKVGAEWLFVLRLKLVQHRRGEAISRQVNDATCFEF